MNDQTPAATVQAETKLWPWVVGIILLMGACGSVMDSESSSSSSHCSRAADARFEYVPGGASSGMRSNFIDRCESGGRDLSRALYGN